MKKLSILTCMGMFILFAANQSLIAQGFKNNTPQLLPFNGNVSTVSKPIGVKAVTSESDEKLNQQSHSGNKVISNNAFETIIGQTTYDLQTNRSTGYKIYQTSAGTIGTTFTRSQQIGPTFPDRGTGYNYYDGNTWGGLPQFNIDTLSWASIDHGSNNTEYVLGHNLSSMVNDLTLLKRSPAGSGTWNKSWLPPHPSGNFCQWARMRIGGTNGATIHVIALTRPAANGGTPLNGIDGALTYSRSQDGGSTWDKIHVALPLVDNSHYAAMSSDSYAIDVRGNVVAITQGSLFNDWVLWKSMDNGNTFTRTVMMQFPIAAYNEMNMITDINSDGIGDTIDFIDGSQAVLIDNNNMVHCWVGRMRVLQEVAGAGELSVFPATDGLLYWNQNFGAANPIMITSTEDIDGSGEIELPEGIQGYSEISLTGMPTVGIDGGSNIFLTYSGIVELTTNGNPFPAEDQAYRNIYCMVSPDNGISWSVPVRIEPSDFDECVYPSMARNVSTDLQIIYHKDGEPGTAVGGSDPFGMSDVIYVSEDPQALFNGVTIVPYSFYMLKGNVYIDMNQNGSKDMGENNAMFFQVQLMPDNVSNQTNVLGNYGFSCDSGTHVVNLLLDANWIITSDSSSYTVTTDSVVTSNLDFGIYPVNSVYNVSTNLTGGIPRCNNYINYWLSYRNTGTVTTSGTVKFVMDNQLNYMNSSPPYTTASADTFFWNFTNLYPSEQRQIHIQTSSFGVFFGDTLENCGYAMYDNGASGGESEDCALQVVICAYDPNDKAVIPEGVGIPLYALLTDTLIYTIRFQNTGNDTAFVVRILDTLDAALDPATFEFIASSHTVEIARPSSNIVLFEFNNILLPDSNVNEPGSNGFVKYSIRPYPGTAIGTEVTNTAHIFFDYNPAIVTNTTFNTLVDVIVGEPEINHHDIQMMAYPNPFSYETTILFSSNLKKSHSIAIVDLAGRRVLEQNKVSGTQITISSHKFTSGLYFCYLNDENGKLVGVQKLVVK